MSVALPKRILAAIDELAAAIEAEPAGHGTATLLAGGDRAAKLRAAHLLGGRLERAVYAIDLSHVVSKYIGETEKNLSHVFDAAEAGGAILLFDEADALFGKRGGGETHDRYASKEVKLLLERISDWGGVAIVAPRDPAVPEDSPLGRLRFVIRFGGSDPDDDE